MKKKLLVVAAHPDDELLGSGGAMRKHVEQGDSVFALILGQGVLSRDGSDSSHVIALQEQARAAGAVLGFEKMFFTEFADNAFDTVPILEITKTIEDYLRKIKPDIVLTHHGHDVNIDHRKTFEAVITASRPCNENAPHTIYSFETLSSTEWQAKSERQFAPTLYVDIEDTIETKLMALAKYESEMRQYPHSRSLEGVRILAQYRGLEANLKYAEAFELVRKIKKS